MPGRTSDAACRAILKALLEIGEPAGATRVAEVVNTYGVNLRPRSVRFHLLRMDRAGLTRCVGRRSGREITREGEEELSRTDVIGKTGFVAAHVDALGYQMTYDPRVRKGSVVVNIAEIDARDLSRAMVHMGPVFERRLTLGSGLAVAMAGERLAGQECPRGKVLLGTVCSVTFSGLFLKAGVPVTSRFGGLVEMREGHPARFTELIEYRGSSRDPLELFILAGFTQVRACASTGTGLIGAGFREFPAAAQRQVQQLIEHLEFLGFPGVLRVGRPNSPLLDIPVAEGRTGMIVLAGLNPFAALREAGVPLVIRSLAGLEDIARFRDYHELALLARRRVPYVE